MGQNYQDLEKQNRTLYTQRWIFLVGLAFYQFFGGISFASFGEISNFYSEYYQVDYSVVDWLTNGRNISAIFITVPLAWFIFKGKVQLRLMVLLVAFSSTLGMLFVTAALTHPSLISLIFIGQFFSGVSETVGIALPSTFAVLWFPENQVGTAIAVNVIGLSTGDGCGYVIPPSLVYTSNAAENVSAYNLSKPMLESGRRSLQIMYGSFLTVAGTFAMLFCAFMTDRPPTAPTAAQEIKNNNNNLEKKSGVVFLRETRSLFSKWSYITMTFLLGLCFQLVILENLMMSEIIHKLDFKHLHLPSDVLSGFTMALWSLGDIVGLLAGGKVVDRFKKYKAQTLASLSLCFLSTVGIALGVYANTAAVIFVCNFLFGVFNGFTTVSALEIATQQTYPIDESLVNTWMTGIQTTMGLLLGVFGRIVFKNFGSVGVLLFQSSLVFVGLIATCFVSSKNKRLDVRKELTPCTSETPLGGETIGPVKYH